MRATTIAFVLLAAACAVAQFAMPTDSSTPVCFGDYTLMNISQIASLNVQQLQSALGFTKAAAEELNQKYAALLQQAEFISGVQIPANWPSLIPDTVPSTDLSQFFLPSPQTGLSNQQSVCGMFSTAGCCTDKQSTIMDQLLTVPVIKSFMDTLGDPSTDCCARSVMTFLCGVQCGPNNYANYNASFFENKDKSVIPVYVNLDTCNTLYTACKDKPTLFGINLEQTVQMLGGQPGESFCNMIQDTQSFALSAQGNTITIPKFHFIYGPNQFPAPGATPGQSLNLTQYLDGACADLPANPSNRATVTVVSGASVVSVAALVVVGLMAVLALLM